MRISFQGSLYKILIDPVLSGLHSCVVENIEPTQNVLDIACGTGSLSLAIALKAKSVIGIDLSEDMIITARRGASKKGIKNVQFDVSDASDISFYKDRQFDVAVTSMAVHQYNAELAIKVLAGMKRIASEVLIADYNHYMPQGYGRTLAWTIERIAGGDHYRNFRNYMQKGGIRWFAGEAGLRISSEVTRSGGIFLVATLKPWFRK
jgi:2-polyprenyl-3-methyl-5-hydroxy-6-metoxy-1,4-benzoquinol methylase